LRKTCVRNKYPISQLYVRACPVRWWIAQSRGPSRRVGSLQQSAVCLDYDARARRRAAGGPKHDADRLSDTARLTLALNELRMPAIKALWPSLPGRPIKTAGPPRGFLAPWWSINWRNTTADASNAMSVRPACYPARRSTTSTSLQFPCCPRLVSTPSPQGIAGLDSGVGKGGLERRTTLCCSDRLARAKAT
jgi:hypothetical protein